MSGILIWDGERLIEITEAQHKQQLAQEKKRHERAQRKVDGIAKGLSENERWLLKQALAEPGRYYGDGGTIHSTTQLDVETHKGKVVSVWFRCLMLPFRQVEVDPDRAREMTSAKVDYRLNGVEYSE